MKVQRSFLRCVNLILDISEVKADYGQNDGLVVTAVE